MPNETIRVGYPRSTYPYVRNVINACDGTEYRHVLNAYDPLIKIAKGIRVVGPALLSRRSVLDQEFRFYHIGQRDVDLYHLFNSVNVGPGAWISTFETCIPRHSATLGTTMPDNNARRDLDRLFECIADDNCRGIIALSENANRIQQNLMERYDTADMERIQSKMHTLYPPQASVVDHVEEKNTPDDRIVFTLVGRAFFRKGGREILNVFTSLPTSIRDQVELNIVSSLDLDPYATGETIEDVEWAQQTLRKHEGWIYYFPSLPHEDVLDLMRRSHVGLLPTHADTFGYSVLEFQAAGCPVITTKVRALPEINDSSCGWLIDVNVNELGIGQHSTDAERADNHARISEGLDHIVKRIVRNPSRIHEKARQALARIRRVHNPADYARQLKSVYQT